ncbi:ATP-binding protein, partial [Oliverpabstia intestinalis]
PINLPYENSDLCVILGNLLDNAIEAAENSENKEIDVRIVYVKNKLKITVKNYYTGKIKKDTGGNFISTKSDTKNHGIGLQSVTRIVDAYGGVMEVRTDHSVFQVDIII